MADPPHPIQQHGGAPQPDQLRVRLPELPELTPPVAAVLLDIIQDHIAGPTAGNPTPTDDSEPPT